MTKHEDAQKDANNLPLGDEFTTDDTLTGAAVSEDDAAVRGVAAGDAQDDLTAQDEQAALLSEKVTKKEHSKTVAALVVCICVIGAFILAGGAWLGWNWMKTSGFFERREVAADVGSESVSALEYRFYYESTINSFYSQNYNYLSYIGIDFSLPLNEQEQSEGVTWADYFKEQTNSSVTELIALYAEAKKNGMTLSNEDKAQIDEYLTAIEEQSALSGMTAQEYLENQYGKGMTPAMLREIAERNYLAIAYFDEIYDSFEYTDAEYEEYYENNRAEFETATFRVYNFSHSHAEDEEDEETDDDHAARNAEDKRLAEEMMSRITDEASFNLLAQEYAPEDEKMSYEDADYTLAPDYPTEYLPEYLASFLFDSARQYGDKTVVEESDGSYSVIYFVSRGRAEGNYVAVRHILIQPEEVDNEDDAAQADDEAFAQAKDLLAQWEAGDRTEDSFAALATDYSQDGGSVASGGLYDHLSQGETVEEFDAWCFDPARKPGDTAIVGTTYGYHIMYFVETQEPVWQYQAAMSLKQQDYNNYYDGLIEQYPLTLHEDVLAKIY